MGVQLEAVTFEVTDAGDVGAFWAGLLRRDLVQETDGVLVQGVPTQVGLRFLTSDTEQVGPRCLHLHVTSTSLDDQERTIELALQLGGRHIDVGQALDDGFVVLADPSGNELCVIEPQNRFLAGSGRLGEVTCDGTRDVGLFWSRALNWPLVWDQDEETAIQSPLGGTKVSWGGPPVERKRERNRQRFDLVAAAFSAEVDRLMSLGATRLVDLADGIELADPEGNEFTLRVR